METIRCPTLGHRAGHDSAGQGIAKRYAPLGAVLVSRAWSKLSSLAPAPLYMLHVSGSSVSRAQETRSRLPRENILFERREFSRARFPRRAFPGYNPIRTSATFAGLGLLLGVEFVKIKQLASLSRRTKHCGEDSPGLLEENASPIPRKDASMACAGIIFFSRRRFTISSDEWRLMLTPTVAVPKVFSA